MSGEIVRPQGSEGVSIKDTLGVAQNRNEYLASFLNKDVEHGAKCRLASGNEGMETEITISEVEADLEEFNAFRLVGGDGLCPRILKELALGVKNLHY